MFCQFRIAFLLCSLFLDLAGESVDCSQQVTSEISLNDYSPKVYEIVVGHKGGSRLSDTHSIYPKTSNIPNFDMVSTRIPASVFVLIIYLFSFVKSGRPLTALCF